MTSKYGATDYTLINCIREVCYGLDPIPQTEPASSRRAHTSLFDDGNRTTSGGHVKTYLYGDLIHR